MKKTIAKLKCWLFGHDWPPYEGAGCDRCGAEYSGDGGGVTGRFWFWWHYRRPRLTALKRCHDCGKWFGNHAKDCPPF